MTRVIIIIVATIAAGVGSSMVFPNFTKQYWGLLLWWFGMSVLQEVLKDAR